MIVVITIKNIPVLEGATAEDFVRNAEKNAVKVTFFFQAEDGIRDHA